MFGFPVHGEFMRGCSARGLLLRVDAGSDHLRELRELIYPRSSPSALDHGACRLRFARLDGETVRFALNLEGGRQIADLLGHDTAPVSRRPARAGQE